MSARTRRWPITGRPAQPDTRSRPRSWLLFAGLLLASTASAMTAPDTTRPDETADRAAREARLAPWRAVLAGRAAAAAAAIASNLPASGAAVMAGVPAGTPGSAAAISGRTTPAAPHANDAAAGIAAEAPTQRPVTSQPGSRSALPRLLPAPAATAAGVVLRPPALSRRWVVTEVIIFDRPAAGLQPGGEQLLQDDPLILPADLISFAPPDPGTVIFYMAEPGSACLAVPAQALAYGGLADPALAGANAIPAAFTAPVPWDVAIAEVAAEAAALAASEPGKLAETDGAGQAEPAAGLADGQPAGATPTDAPTPAPAAVETVAELAMSAPTPPPPDPVETLAAALIRYEADLDRQATEWLAPEAHVLTGAARRLEQAGGYRVLLHEAWLQDLNRQPALPPLLIGPTPAVGGLGSLAGTLQLARTRGLRFIADLRYRPADAGADLPGEFRLVETRRVSLGKTYYLDHPRLGVIVRSASVVLPASIVAAWNDIASGKTLPQPAPVTPAAAATPTPE